LRLPECRAETPGIEELTEREMLEAILGSVQYAHVKLDHIRDLLEEDGEEEADETDR
jgi:hypothetical protein